MATLTVRVVPRSGRREVALIDGSVVIRVRPAPEDGKATEEARRVLAEALGVPASAVRLRSGARSRTKIFELEGLTEAQVERLLARR